MSRPKKMKKVVSKRKVKERTYLTEEEQNVMKPVISDWMGKKDKNSKDAFIASDILPKIQALNLEKYGPDIISKDKASKEMWDKRVQVRVDLCWLMKMSDLLLKGRTHLDEKQQTVQGEGRLQAGKKAIRPSDSWEVACGQGGRDNKGEIP